jgi:hypothetical protein
MSSDGKDQGMICGMTADEREVLRRGLDELPDTVPPRALWKRIREQAEAEGLVRRRLLRRPINWYGGAGLAAAMLAIAVLVPEWIDPSRPDSLTVPRGAAQQSQVQLSALPALMVESQQLESDLRALPSEPRVRMAGTVVALSNIEDRIAAIDYQLNDPAVRMTPEEQEVFWRERVRLMTLLVRLRYAQAQRTAFQ